MAHGVQLVWTDESTPPACPGSVHSTLQMLHKYSSCASLQTPQGTLFAPRIMHLVQTLENHIGGKWEDAEDLIQSNLCS